MTRTRTARAAAAGAVVLGLLLSGCAGGADEPGGSGATPQTGSDAATESSAGQEPGGASAEDGDGRGTQIGTPQELLDALEGFAFQDHDDFVFVESSLGFEQFAQGGSGVEFEPARCGEFLDSALTDLQHAQAATVAGPSRTGGLRVDVSSHRDEADAQAHYALFDGLLDHCSSLRQVQNGQVVAEVDTQEFAADAAAADEALGFTNDMRDPRSGDTAANTQVVVRDGVRIITATVDGADADAQAVAAALAAAVAQHLG